MQPLSELIDPTRPSDDRLNTLISSFEASFSAVTQDRLVTTFKTHPEIQQQLSRCVLCSLFFVEQLHRQPDFFLLLMYDNDMRCERSTGNITERTIASRFTQFIAAEAPTADAGEASQKSQDAHDISLRNLRNLFMLRIIWRDINRLSTLVETMRELSLLADFCIQSTLNFHSKRLIEQHGMPKNHQDEAQDFYVLGMGKLGAYELNLSSDIDLIFCYPEVGSCEKEQPRLNKPPIDDAIDNQSFFSKLGKRVIQSLDAIRHEGFVFRVDMRLRPYGQSGPLVSHFAALEDYYYNQGREWERYAMVKARLVAHTAHSKHASLHSKTLMTSLNQFVYRKYIDFSVIDALRELKVRIQKEVRRRKLLNDLKLGEGGIREIEFIVQSFQLIRGGRDKELQVRDVHQVLPLLEQLRCLPHGCAHKLHAAYTFLRCSEHAIQAYQDKQTQKLPADSAAQAALSMAMGYTSWQRYLDALQTHRDIVSEVFQGLIQEKQSPSQTQGAASNIIDSYRDAWQSASATDDPTPETELSEGLFSELQQFAQSHVVQGLTKDSKERLDQFMPCLMKELQAQDNAETTFRRIQPLIQAISRRSAYLVLLVENPSALEQLIKLTSTSQHIADGLSRNPALLDELLDARNLYTLPDDDELENELRRMMLRIEADDLEQQMETLRYFKLSHALRIAACEVSHTLPLMKVSDYLTRLAEVIVRSCQHLAWDAMTRRHGFPSRAKNSENDALCEPDFLVVGYGKLGGIEMNHGSDLDLVFIHDADINGYSDGKRNLDNHTFYTRMGQKIIHMMNTRTPSGRLYEIDMRLRPSGNSGLLASSFKAFEKYQDTSAWTWEHQALIRARAISGNAALAGKFNALRKRVLCQARERQQLACDIVDMRRKMREQLGSKPNNPQSFHLKHDRGGIVDIEFMVQYFALAWSHQYPSIVEYTDNIRILQALADVNILSTEDLEKLTNAYKSLRQELHRLTIQQAPSIVPTTELVDVRDNVTSIWQNLFSDYENRPR